VCENDPIRTRDPHAPDSKEKRSSSCTKLVLQKLRAISYPPATFQRSDTENADWLCSRLDRDQNLDLQRDALAAAGCEHIFEDKASGVRDDRPGLTEALSHLRPGDCLVIWRLDRLGRRMIALLGFVEELR
jgi:Resolvase, N terminal domain